MTTYRVQHDKKNPYVVLSKGFLEDPRLSAKAKGVLAYLLSKPDGWVVKIEQLAQVFTDGMTSLRSALRSLEKTGYFRRYPVRDDRGRIVQWVKDVFEFSGVADVAEEEVVVEIEDAIPLPPMERQEAIASLGNRTEDTLPLSLADPIPNLPPSLTYLNVPNLPPSLQTSSTGTEDLEDLGDDIPENESTEARLLRKAAEIEAATDNSAIIARRDKMLAEYYAAKEKEKEVVNEPVVETPLIESVVTSVAERNPREYKGKLVVHFPSGTKFTVAGGIKKDNKVWHLEDASGNSYRFDECEYADHESVADFNNEIAANNNCLLEILRRNTPPGVTPPASIQEIPVIAEDKTIPSSPDGAKRRYNRYTSRWSSISSDPWMSGQYPDSDFQSWLQQKQQAKGKTYSISDAAAEIRNNYERAGDLWQEYQGEIAIAEQTRQAIEQAKSTMITPPVPMLIAEVRQPDPEVIKTLKLAHERWMRGGR